MPALDLHHYPPYSTNGVKDNRPQIFSNQCIGQLGMCKTLLSWYFGDEWLPIAIETSFDKTRNLSCSALRAFTCLKSGRIAPLRQLSDSKGQEPNSCTLVRDTNKRTGWGCNLYIETLTGRQVDSCQGGGGGGEVGGGWVILGLGHFGHVGLLSCRETYNTKLYLLYCKHPPDIIFTSHTSCLESEHIGSRHIEHFCALSLACSRNCIWAEILTLTSPHISFPEQSRLLLQVCRV